MQRAFLPRTTHSSRTILSHLIFLQGMCRRPSPRATASKQPPPSMCAPHLQLPERKSAQYPRDPSVPLLAAPPRQKAPPGGRLTGTGKYPGGVLNRILRKPRRQHPPPAPSQHPPPPSPADNHQPSPGPAPMQLRAPSTKVLVRCPRLPPAPSPSHQPPPPSTPLRLQEQVDRQRAVRGWELEEPRPLQTTLSL